MLYRQILVWLLRVTGIVCLVLTIGHVIMTFQLFAAYDRGEGGITYILDLMLPIGAALVAGAIVALSLAETLSLLTNRPQSR